VGFAAAAAAPPKLNTPGVADAAVVAGVAAAAAPKLKLEPAGAGAAAAVVEAAAGCCPKEKSPLEGAVLSEAAAAGPSGFLPNPPKVDVAAPPKLKLDLVESVTSGLGRLAGAAAVVAVLPKEKGAAAAEAAVEVEETPNEPPPLPKLKTPLLSLGFSVVEAAVDTPPKENIGLEAEEEVVVVAGAVVVADVVELKENAPELEVEDAAAVAPKLKAGLVASAAGLTASVFAAAVAPKLNGGGAALAATSGFVEAAAPPNENVGAAAAVLEEAVVVVAGLAADPAPKLKAEAAGSAGLVAAGSANLADAPKLKAAVELVVEVTAVVVAAAAVEAAPKLNAGGGAVVTLTSEGLTAVAGSGALEGVVSDAALEAPNENELVELVPKEKEGFVVVASVLVLVVVAVASFEVDPKLNDGGGGLLAASDLVGPAPKLKVAGLAGSSLLFSAWLVTSGLLN